MIEIFAIVYGIGCWLVFKKFRWLEWNVNTGAATIFLGIVSIGTIFGLMAFFHPYSKDGTVYAYTTPIVPQVRGRVTEVLVEPDARVEEGDPLFQIEDRPYADEVIRLTAELAEVSQAYVPGLVEQMEAAGARARAIDAQLDLANRQYRRARELVPIGAAPASELDAARAERARLEAELEAARSDVRRLEASISAQVEGENARVVEIRAQLDVARFNRASTTVRAPTDGYVTQLQVRPGVMASPLPFAPLAVFVHSDAPILIASFPQQNIRYVESDNEAEFAFDAVPGYVFKGKVRAILPAFGQGQLSPSGQLISTPTTDLAEPGRVFVQLLLDDYDPTELGAPIGGSMGVAIYTHRFHAGAMVRRIIVRINSWLNYLPFSLSLH